MEIGDVAAQHLGRVARRIDGDEDRLHLGAPFRVALLEAAQPGADRLEVDRADVGAEGEAEIDQTVLAGELGVTDPAPLVAGQRERPAHRRALERPRARLAAAAPSSKAAGQQGDRGGDAQDGAFVHDRGSLALLRAINQAE